MVATKPRQSAKCPRKSVAGKRQNSWSPKCRLTRWTRWPRAISARPSRSKKLDIGPCRNKTERGFPSAWLGAAPRRLVSSGAKTWYWSIALGGIERGAAAAGAPALMPEPDALEEIDRFPIEHRLAQPERGNRPRVEPGPRQERVAPAKRPDLYTRRRPGARAAGVKTEGVGDDEGVGRSGDRPWRRQTEFGQNRRRDRADQLLIGLTRRLAHLAARRDAHRPFPFEALRRQAVRARHVDERHRIRLDIGQEEPRLDRRMKRVGVQIALRIGRGVRRPGNRAGEDGLDVDHRGSGRGSGIAQQVAVLRQIEQTPRRRNTIERRRIEGDVPGDRVAFGDLARRRPQRADLGHQIGEDILWQKVALDDKAVAVELPAILGRDQPRQPATARLGEPPGGGDPRGMQPVLVEPTIADDRIAREKLFLAENLGKPQRHQQGLTQQRRHRAFGPPNPNRLVGDATLKRSLRRAARLAFAPTKTDPPLRGRSKVRRQLRAARILTRSPALSTIFFRNPRLLRSPIISERCAGADQSQLRSCRPAPCQPLTLPRF